MRALHATNGPLTPTGPSNSGMRDPTEMVSMMGPGPREGPKMTLLDGALFIFCKPGTRAKVAYRTKRGSPQHLGTLSLPLVIHLALGWVLSCFWGLELDPIRYGMGLQV